MAASGGFPPGQQAQARPEGHGTWGGLSGKERTALLRATSRANGTKFGQPRKVDDAVAARLAARYGRWSIPSRCSW